MDLKSLQNQKTKARETTTKASFNGEINCYNMNISDLTGIEYFIALTELICYDNQLTSKKDVYLRE